MAYKEAFAKLGERSLVPSNYLEQGLQAATAREHKFRHFMDQRKWPDEGWDDETIEILVRELSAMDSNNFPSRAGVGEREGRCYSNLVARRHYGMIHGIGRSGDLGEAQPKAAGSTAIANLTNCLVLDWLRTFVSPLTSDAFVMPLATGMSITFCLQTMRLERPKAKYVIWSRIDQKSCYKAIITAGLNPIVVSPVLCDDELKTDLDTIEKVIKELGEKSILCVITTTSCFAPRAADGIIQVAAMCAPTRIYHLVNNAYGVGVSKCANLIAEAARSGKVSVYVQSTDKNLMVPVGGTVIAGFDDELLKKIRKNYPGRASFSQSLDVFITMLSMGKKQFRSLISRRAENYAYLKEKMAEIAERYGERILNSPGNTISIGMSLRFFGEDPSKASQLGSMLFSRSIQGARVVIPNQEKTLDKLTFQGWGSHCDSYPLPYLTAAASIGVTKSEIDFFIQKLQDCFKTLRVQSIPSAPGTS